MDDGEIVTRLAIRRMRRFMANLSGQSNYQVHAIPQDILNFIAFSEPGFYEQYKADTGALRFKVRCPMGEGFPTFALTSKTDPEKELYQVPHETLSNYNFNNRVFFGPIYKFLDKTQGGQEDSKRFSLAEPIGSEFREFWLTWHSNVICMGVDGESKPILTYENDKIGTNNIGFIKFYVTSNRRSVEWIFEASPVILKPLKDKSFEGGHLHWKIIPENNPVLPDDALVAGFECEPLYISRAEHNGSLCPGKYVPSEHFAYVPWGRREHRKRSNEILCGWNVKWVKTRGNYIPENAYEAGYSEIRHEPLYVGRALYDNLLLVGKVHPHYSACYLPYKGREIEVHEYEILVTTDVIPRGVSNFITSGNTVDNRNIRILREIIF